MTEIDWDKVEEYRFLGMSWLYIAQKLGISIQCLLRERKKQNMPIKEPHLSNTGKKICLSCRHMYDKKLLKRVNMGRYGNVCPDCYKKIKGEM